MDHIRVCQSLEEKMQCVIENLHGKNNTKEKCYYNSSLGVVTPSSPHFHDCEYGLDVSICGIPKGIISPRKEKRILHGVDMLVISMYHS